MIRICILFSILLLTGCSQSLYMQGRKLAGQGEYNKAIDLYYEEIRNNPQSAEAWRELGVALYEKGDLTKAEDALKQANNMQPDARANLFIGLIYEKQQMYDEALGAYRKSLGMNPKKKTKELISAHLDQLISKKIDHEVSAALKQEADIDVDTIPDNSIGVVDFDNSQLPPDMAPLAKGLAEMTANDLAKVNSLKVVDRLKIDAILNELKLSSSLYADPKVGPRLGKLMGSSRIVSGVVTGIGDDEIRLDGAIVNTRDDRTRETAPTQDKLQKFFQLQKDFVFEIIDTLGIRLTAAERDEIQKVPTESYLAFLAYSKGLDFRSRGMYQDAAQEFNQAVKMDANFGAAREQKLSSEHLSAGAGGGDSFEQFEASATSSTEESSGTGTVESYQSSVLSNSGFIGDSYLLDGNRPDVIPRPTPVYNVGTVIIRGSLDVEQ